MQHFRGSHDVFAKVRVVNIGDAREINGKSEDPFEDFIEREVGVGMVELRQALELDQNIDIRTLLALEQK